MAKHVDEIMNHELFCVDPEETAVDVLLYLCALGISAAPVVDEARHPVGFISVRDLALAADEQPVALWMTSPADTIAWRAPIREAAERLATTGRHHLACVDDEGRVVGFLGSLDVLRGVMGFPVPHPESFPHYDRIAGVRWSDDEPLTAQGIRDAPQGPGLFRLIRSRPGESDRVVWTEGARSIRGRLGELLSAVSSPVPDLVDENEREALLYRAASTPTPREFAEAVTRTGAYGRSVG